jgi:hypothetical protein
MVIINIFLIIKPLEILLISFKDRKGLLISNIDISHDEEDLAGYWRKLLLGFKLEYFNLDKSALLLRTVFNRSEESL